jgi:predicted PurR-regulated permease PerM
MPTRRNTFTPDHPIVIAFLVFAVIGFLGLASEFLKPLALAVLLSFALAPLAGFLERRGLPRVLAVVLTIVLALGALGGITYKVGEQLTMLAHDTRDLRKYGEHIKAKLTWLKPQQENALMRLTAVAADVAQTLEEPRRQDGVQPVRIVTQPSFTQRVQTAVGPYLERLGVMSFVLILVLFMLNSRDDLSDRIIRLFGQGRVSVTTRTMDEVGQRISRYLGMFTLVNSSFGLIIGLGLWMIGLPYVVLWGVLFALLRFIPYVGPAAAFALPLLFSFAYFDSWREPLLVVALFGTLEIVANSFLEPVIYGRTTGVSALGLLVAAMFWTWLWGGLGLLLSTPLTVCLAALGKYVPGLAFFAVLLGEEDPLEPDVRFYQRLLAMDQDGAIATVETALKQQPREVVFDQILIPALSRAGYDRGRDEIDSTEQAFIWRVVGDLIDDLEEIPATDMKSLETAAADAAKSAEELPDASAPAPVPRLLGINGNDHADLLVLRMLALLLPPRECTLTILETPESPLKLAEQVAEIDPDLVLVSHLPPQGATAARYLVRRLRARCADVPILVGHWRTKGDREGTADRLTNVGATAVVFRLAEARDLILRRIRADQAASPIASVSSGFASSLIAERIR